MAKNQLSSSAVGKDGALLPEHMKERIKKLEKENTLLKQELENRFDKDKVIMKNKLDDAIREKRLLEQTKEQMEEQMKKLQMRVVEMNFEGKSGSTESIKAYLEEFQKELAQIGKERDQYFL